MHTPSVETPEDGNLRRKSIVSGGSNLAGGKNRRYSIGITSSRKNIVEGNSIIPNYLRASTGSCHDFCKFGKKHEPSKSTIPIKFKKTTIVNKETVTKTVVPVERKKITTVKKLELSEVTKKNVPVPSKKPQVSKRVLSTNGKTTENELKMAQRFNDGNKKKDVITVKKTVMTPKTLAIKTVKYRSVKQMSPLKDQNRLEKPEPEQTVADKAQTKTVHEVKPESVVKPESLVKPERIEFDFIHPVSQSFSGENVVEEEFVEAQAEVKLEVNDFDFIHPVVDFIRPLDERSELFLDKQLLEESFYDEVLEDESDYTDKEEDSETETAFNDQTETSVGNHKKIPRKGKTVISDEKDDEGVKLRFKRGKILDLKCENKGPRRLKFRKANVIEGKEVKQHIISRRSFEKKNVDKKIIDLNDCHESVVLKHQGEQGKKDSQGLFNNVIEATASKLVESRKSKVKALVGAFETVISLQDGKP